ncbi:Hsp20/alpha crystallin family protein [Brevifollis gellanilyticus]|uniref:SHSP domain-containing protein n=1 Tax=Brevifollis gellanilyticus TaxID=748831 RepID=A0A512M8N3_9BACT|nr:Hsp20/alpha crystallin family protein [Brevifollis gellanilyticus]GEP43082.1 hypothetical protein BGE01nite_23730 [Brevifollis gellanilyticus]
MKTHIQLTFVRHMVAVLCVAGFVSFITLQGLAEDPKTPPQKEQAPPGFMEKMKRWQDEMSNIFRDSWGTVKGAAEEQSSSTASVDLREKQDSYMVRLHLPGRTLESVEIRKDGNSLHINAPAESGAGRYEQVIKLEQAQSGKPIQVERKQADHVIVVTVPKGTDVADSLETLKRHPIVPYAPLDQREQDVFARMEKMRREMDRIFNESFHEFRFDDGLRDFFDSPRFGATVDLQEEADKYVIRAYLPDRNMENVNVTVEGATVRIEAKNEEAARSDNSQGYTQQRTQYAQLLTIPGPFKAEKMKVDKKEALIVVTLPKS